MLLPIEFTTDNYCLCYCYFFNFLLQSNERLHKFLRYRCGFRFRDFTQQLKTKLYKYILNKFRLFQYKNVPCKVSQTDYKKKVFSKEDQENYFPRGSHRGEIDIHIFLSLNNEVDFAWILDEKICREAYVACAYEKILFISTNFLRVKRINKQVSLFFLCVLILGLVKLFSIISMECLFFLYFNMTCPRKLNLL